MIRGAGVAAAAAAVLAAGACKPGSGTGPGTYHPPQGVAFTDPATVLSGVAEFEAVFGVPALRSVMGLGGVVGVAGAPPVRGAAGASCGGAAPAGPAFSPLGVLPDSVSGWVFVYDSATARFQAGADSGGPAGGVEFVLPVVDSLNRVLFPQQNAGTLDLYDVTPPAGMLTLHSVVTGAGGSADYTFADSGTTTAYSGILAGTASGGGKTITFRDSTTGLYLQVTAGAVLNEPDRGVQMLLTATRTATDPYDNYYGVDFTFRSAGQAVRVVGNITTYCLLPSMGLTVSINDTDFAIVNGSTYPLITGLADSTLTDQQDSALRALIRGQAEMYSWLTALTQPAKQFLGP